MNVKANQRILQLDGVDELFVFPSCGDETNPIGASLLVHSQQEGVDHLEPLGPRIVDHAGLLRCFGPGGAMALPRKPGGGRNLSRPHALVRLCLARLDAGRRPETEHAQCGRAANPGGHDR